MKTYIYKIKNETLHLLYNAEAMIRITELGDGDKISDITKNKTKESFDKLLKIVCIMAEQGELYRRYLGYEPANIITEDALRIIATPKDWAVLKVGVLQAFVEGMSQDCTDEDEEIDLGLMELNKDKKKESPEPK